MASWLQSQLRAAEGLLEAVDRTAKVTSEQHPIPLPSAGGKLGGGLRREGGGGSRVGEGADPTAAGLPSATEPAAAEPEADNPPSQAAACLREPPPLASNSPAGCLDLKPALGRKGSGSLVRSVKGSEKKVPKSGPKGGRLSRTSSNGSRSGSTPKANDSAKEPPPKATVSPFETAAGWAQGAPPQPPAKPAHRASREEQASATPPAAAPVTDPWPQLSSAPEPYYSAKVPDPAGDTPAPGMGASAGGGVGAAEVPAPSSVDFQDHELELSDTTLLDFSQHDQSLGKMPQAGEAADCAPALATGRAAEVAMEEEGGAVPGAQLEMLRAGVEPTEERPKVEVPGQHEVVAEVAEAEEKQEEEEEDGDDDGDGDETAEAEEGEEEEATADEEEAAGEGSAGEDQLGAWARSRAQGRSVPRGAAEGGDAQAARGGSGATLGLHHDLEEARELAKLSAAVGASREVRLQRVCDKLRARLEELKEENSQLEELLAQADARASGGAGEAESLRAELKQLRAAHGKAERSLQAQLAAQEADLRERKADAERHRGTAAALQQKLDQLQETTEELLRERQTSEGRLVAALRDQVAEAEHRLDEERAAHALTRKAAASRHEQLEADLSESASDISGLHRSLEERSGKIAELESHVVMLEEEHEQTAAKLRRAEETASREKARAEANSNDALEAQVEAWKEEAEKGRKNALDLEGEKSELQADNSRLARQVEELEALVRDARGAADSDLARRHKEVTELLYLKQTQLEKMAAEKAAQQLSLEREVAGLREELDRARRQASTVRDPMETYGSAELMPMDSIGAYYTRLANDERLGGAVKAFAKAVDVTAANAMRLMREYPLARVIFFIYSICIHLFVYVLIQRLQSKILLGEEGLPDPDGPQQMMPPAGGDDATPTAAAAPASLRVLLGLQGANKVWHYRGSDATAPRRSVIFFVGDQLEGRDVSAEVHAAQEPRVQAAAMASKWPGWDVLVVMPSRLEAGCGCFDHFLTKTTRTGEPLGYQGHTLKAAGQLWSLLGAAGCLAEDWREQASWQGGNRAPPTFPEIILVGFSKGGVVLNQVLTELAHAFSPEDTSAAPGAVQGVDWPPPEPACPAALFRTFLASIREFHFCDAGLHCRGAFMTDPRVAAQLPAARAAGCAPRVVIHGSPRQLEDPTRPWMRAEAESCIKLLSDAGVDAKLERYFVGEALSLEMHFRTIRSHESGRACCAIRL
eukprot:jgi/Tetstr1/447433/TSEL_003693.t2